MSRTDCHRPSAIIPSDYVFQDVFHTGFHVGEGEFYEDMEVFNGLTAEDMVSHELPSVGRSLRCNVCGTLHKQGGLFLHKPTGKYIIAGRKCAAKYNALTDWGRLERFEQRGRKMRGALLQRLKRRKAARAWLVSASSEVRTALRRKDLRIVRDIRSKLAKFGRISEKQVALVLKLAEQPIEKRVDGPVGKHVVEGEILSVKMRYGLYDDRDGTPKVTVKVTEPCGGFWLAWGTLPAALFEGAGAEYNGRRVQFTANLERGRDRSFVVFKRPSKASYL